MSKMIEVKGRMYSEDSLVEMIKAHADFEEKPIYKRGDKFVHRDFGDKYIIAQINTDLCTLISMEDGNRWHFPPLLVGDSHKITEKEFDQMCNGKTKDFIKES